MMDLRIVTSHTESTGVGPVHAYKQMLLCYIQRTSLGFSVPGTIISAHVMVGTRRKVEIRFSKQCPPGNMRSLSRLSCPQLQLTVTESYPSESLLWQPYDLTSSKTVSDAGILLDSTVGGTITVCISIKF